MKDAFDKAKKENGREAVNPREQASQTFSLLTTVGHRLKYSPPSVNLVQTNGVRFNNMAAIMKVSSKVSVERQHFTRTVSGKVSTELR